MESGLSIRPASVVTDAAFLRPEPVQVRTAVATQLASPQSVTAMESATRASGHDLARDGTQQNMKREIDFDAQTSAVIFRVIDESTGQVDQQVPDAALLRLRAYYRTLLNGNRPSKYDGNTDTEA